MNKINFYASEIHYFQHIVPIWQQLPFEYKGIFYISEIIKDKIQQYNVAVEVGSPIGLTLVASWNDYLRTKGPVIFMEHGIGHTYSIPHSCYAGGIGKDRVILFLNQHFITQQKNITTYPNIPNVIIGTPKMDNIQNRHIKNKVACLSFHWDCKVSPESRSAFYYYREIIKELAKNPNFELIMHGHPHGNGGWQRGLQSLGVKFYSEFEDILNIADVYINDNSSTMYEFAASGRPVVVLNCPYYRKDVNHGIRFWDYIPGVQVDNPLLLAAAIEETFNNPYEWDKRREAVITALYPYRGQASPRAVDAIINILNEKENV